jgi:hypothetical protein
MPDQPVKQYVPVLRVTEPGIPGAWPQVLAEWHGAIGHTVTQEFEPIPGPYRYPGTDIYEFTSPRVTGLDIALDFSNARMTSGAAHSVFGHPNSLEATFVGIELWSRMKPVDLLHPGDPDPQSDTWLLIRYHRCTARWEDPTSVAAHADRVPVAGLIYTAEVLTQGDYLPTLKRDDDGEH